MLKVTIKNYLKNNIQIYRNNKVSQNFIKLFHESIRFFPANKVLDPSETAFIKFSVLKRYNSKYFKRKKKILSFFNKNEYIIKSELIKLKTLEISALKLKI